MPAQEPADKFNLSASGFERHLICSERCSLQTGVRATLVPYQQGQQRIADLLNGTNHFAFYNTPAVVNLVPPEIRALAVTAPKRVAALEGVPTIAEQGFPDLVVPGEDWVGFAVRSGTPTDVVARLNQAMNRALTKPKIREAFANVGAEPVGGTVADFGNLIEAQIAYWGKVVKESGIKMPQ